MVVTYSNDTGQAKTIDIPVEYNNDGTVKRTKSHTLEPGERLAFEDGKSNTDTIINQCIAKSLNEI